VSDFLFKASTLAVSLETGMTTLKIAQVSPHVPCAPGQVPRSLLEPIDLVVGNNELRHRPRPSAVKSTLLRIVAGLDRPTTGRVRRDCPEVAGPGADRGMVFQSTRFPGCRFV